MFIKAAFPNYIVTGYTDTKSTTIIEYKDVFYKKGGSFMV